MIKPVKLSQLMHCYGGERLGDDAFIHAVSTDTRSIRAGDLFVALVGKQFNGHDYLDQAIEKQVSALVVEKNSQHLLPKSVFTEKQLSVWLVDDTTHALGHIAQWQRDQFRGPLIAITGSGGKTTVKGMLRDILSTSAGKASVFATHGNLNNHIGVPLSLLSLEPQHQYAVIEMGASGANEIGYLSAMAKPNVAMVTNVMPAHVEGFGSVDGIATAKGEIYQGLISSGTAIVNGDDVYANQWIDGIEQASLLIFSASDKNAQADLCASNIRLQGNGCYSFSLVCAGQSIEINLSVIGRHNISNAIAAGAAAHAVGISLESIAKGLKVFSGEAGRLQRLPGLNGSTLIDDTYNANPGSVKAAIEVLSDLSGTTILVLGDMAELGSESEAMHASMGAYAQQKSIDRLFTLGDKSQLSAAAFGAHADHHIAIEALIEQLNRALASDVTVLVKGSRSARMERVIDALKFCGEHDVSLAR